MPDKKRPQDLLVRRLYAGDQADICNHFLRLDVPSRRARFCGAVSNDGVLVIQLPYRRNTFRVIGCPGYVDDAPVHHVVQTGTSAACYAVVEKTADGWATAFRHVPYDPSRMVELAKAANHPNWEARLTTGWVSWEA
ncbi:MAG: hypothetical protein AAGJ68_14335 [Pseudomonadota bacterium]